MVQNRIPQWRTAWGLWFKSALLASLPLLLTLLTPGQLQAQSCVLYPSPHLRFGVNVDTDGGKHVADYDMETLNAHWYLDYKAQLTPARPANMDYTQMVRVGIWQNKTLTQTVGPIVDANPGMHWIVGNEPDRAGQDGLTPATYARFYHEVYTFLKARDPSSQVGVAGVVQATPLRLRYLTMVLDEYQARYGAPLPTDLWNLHGFILPENYIWGASIPPGLEDFAAEGKQYGVGDHGNLTIFKVQIVNFRQWMADHGYRDKPLSISEYGILLPPAYGYPYATVRNFMLESFNFFLNTTDSTTGYPADANRLVQNWSWFSLNSPPYDANTGIGFNGNLFNPTTHAFEPLGLDFANYVASVANDKPDLALTNLQVTPVTMVMTSTSPVTVTARLSNKGGNDVQEAVVQLWLIDATDNRTLLSQSEPIATIGAGCGPIPIQLTWQPAALPVGAYTLAVEASAANGDQESNTADNIGRQSFHVLDEALTNFTYLPLIGN